MKTRIVAYWLVAFCSASHLNAAPFLEGTVTDEQGRPVVGASVEILDCVGTCFGGTTVLTDADGRYLFPEKPFRNYPLLRASMPGRYEVSRRQLGPALHEPDTETPRKVDFVLGTPAAAHVWLEGHAPEGWTQTVEIRSAREAEPRRYPFTPRSERHKNDWGFDLLPRNEPLHLVITRMPVTIESEDPSETRDRRLENWRNRVEIVSPPVRLPDPQCYLLQAKVEFDAASDTSYVVWTSVTDAVSENRTDELTTVDARFGPPVDATTREKALELLNRAKEAAAPWNARPSRDIAAYEYDAIDRNGEKTHVHIDEKSPSGPAWSDIARQRGFAYMPPLRWLFLQPDNIVFHGVEVSDDHSVLHYRLKERRGFSVGVGIGPRWHGFVSTRFSRGTLVMDSKTGTILEHRFSDGVLGKESIETFGEYVAVEKGFAPQTLKIQVGSLDVRFRFRIHDGELWLLDEAFHRDQSEPSFRITNVVVRVAE